MAGSSPAMAANATVPSPATAQNVARQPNVCPIQVPSGTPVTIATVRPMNIMAIAEARRSSGTRSAAMVEPTAKNTPWANADSTRATSSVS